LHKIVFEEYPAPPDLGSRDLAALGALPQFLGMKAQELRSFLEVERVHHVTGNHRVRDRRRDAGRRINATGIDARTRNMT